jgi:glucokinase
MWRLRWFDWVAAAMVLLISFSRVYLGVHAPLDALGGAAIGLFLVFLHARVEPVLERWTARVSPAVNLALAILLPAWAAWWFLGRDRVSWYTRGRSMCLEELLMGDFVVGADLGGTQIRAFVSDAQGNVCGRAATLTCATEGPDAVIGRIEETIRQAVGAIPWGDIRGIGVGAPGPLDPWEGVILGAPNLPGWERMPLAAILSRAFGCDVRVGKDANLGALGEHIYGAGRGVANLVYMTISTGIGGGVIANGQLLLGAGGLAGEVGHQTIIADGPLCPCGNYGCLESLAAGPAIGRMGREAADGGRGERMLSFVQGVTKDIDARTVSRAAEEGDPVAVQIIGRAANYIGIGLANICNLFNPELLVLGGGVTHVGDLLFDTVRAVIAQRALPAARGVRVVPAALGDDVVLYGAAALISRWAPGGRA